MEFIGLYPAAVIHFVIWVCKGILWYFGLLLIAVLGMLARGWIRDSILASFAVSAI